MSAMDTDDVSVVLPASHISGLSLSLHPLPILSISEHLMRVKLQRNEALPFVLGALLGTQNGREVDIVNTFELATVEGDADSVDHEFLKSRKESYKQVFPSLEFIGFYTVAQHPTAQHVALHEQFTDYCSTPLLLLLQPTFSTSTEVGSQNLPFKAYEPTVEIKERTSRTMFIEASFSVETGEAERIAVDWTAKGGGVGTSCKFFQTITRSSIHACLCWCPFFPAESHLQSQRAAVKMLHDRIVILVKYVTQVISGEAVKDHSTLRSLASLVASLPASENIGFREEFNKEQEDVQLTAFLSTLTKSANILNGLVDKHVLLTSNNRDPERIHSSTRRRLARHGPSGMMGDWDKMR